MSLSNVFLMKQVLCLLTFVYISRNVTKSFNLLIIFITIISLQLINHPKFLRLHKIAPYIVSMFSHHHFQFLSFHDISLLLFGKLGTFCRTNAKILKQ